MANIQNSEQETFLDSVFSMLRGKKPSPTKTEGVSGTAIYGGFVDEQEKQSKLRGTKKYVTYSDMLANTEIIATGVRYFLNILSKSKWKVEPSDPDDPKSLELAKLIEDMMDDMTTPWHRVVRRAAMYRFYGFSIQEWTAKKRADNVIGMKDIEPRAQRTITKWDTDSSGTVFGVVQQSPQTSREIYLNREKLVYLVDDSINDSPEGLGVFRQASIINDRVDYYLELEGIGFETDLRGVPIGRGPFSVLSAAVENGSIKEAEKIKIEKGLKDIVENHIKNPKLGLLLDSATYRSDDEKATPSAIRQWDFELVKGTSNSQSELNVAIERETQSLARLFGVEHLMLGTTTGSRSLSEDKSANFALVIDSVLIELEEQFDKDFIETIFQLNGWDKELMPKFQTEAAQFRDVKQITGALDDLARAGAPLDIDDPVINDIRELLGVTLLNLEKQSERSELEDEMRRMLNREQQTSNVAAEQNLDPSNQEVDGDEA